MDGVVGDSVTFTASRPRLAEGEHMASARSRVNRSRRPFSSVGLFLFSVDDSGRRERTTISFGRSVLSHLAHLSISPQTYQTVETVRRLICLKIAAANQALT